MIFELLGPSGVGKTTILGAAGALEPRSRPWRLPAEVEMPAPDAALRRAALDDYPVPGFVNRCLDLIAASTMRPSQKATCVAILQKSLIADHGLRRRDRPAPVVHDELVLHRAMSILPYSPDPEADAAWFFGHLRLPDGAVIVRNEPETIVARALARPSPVNLYYALDRQGLERIVATSARVAEIAAERLAQRGLAVLSLESRCLESAARALDAWVRDRIGPGRGAAEAPSRRQMDPQPRAGSAAPQTPDGVRSPAAG